MSCSFKKFTVSFRPASFKEDSTSALFILQGQVNGLEGRAREAEQNFRNLHHQSSIEIQNLSHQNEALARQVNEMQMLLHSRQNPTDELKAELESAKQTHAAELNNLHSQIGMRTKEIAQLKQQVHRNHNSFYRVLYCVNCTVPVTRHH